MIYIYRLLTSSHRNMEISRKAISCVNSFVVDMFERLAGEASRLASLSKRTTRSHPATSSRPSLGPNEISFLIFLDRLKRTHKLRTSKSGHKSQIVGKGEELKKDLGSGKKLRNIWEAGRTWKVNIYSRDSFQLYQNQNNIASFSSV